VRTCQSVYMRPYKQACSHTHYVPQPTKRIDGWPWCIGAHSYTHILSLSPNQTQRPPHPLPAPSKARRLGPRQPAPLPDTVEAAATSPPRVPASPHHPRTNQRAHARTHGAPSSARPQSRLPPCPMPACPPRHRSRGNTSRLPASAPTIPTPSANPAPPSPLSS
jgi:hypothetical protein